MKTTLSVSAAIVLASASLSYAGPPAGYTVHEWGTFTSFQGGDGKPVPWNPLQTSELPVFVHQAGSLGDRYLFTGTVRPMKGSMVTLQRMETPVMYFYPTSPMKVDVSVDFPNGLITEWYPQVTAFGPIAPFGTNTHPITALDKSRATWQNLELLPGSAAASPGQLIQEARGTRYFAARATSAALVQTKLPAPGQGLPELEKFIFYRGAGNFPTPLQVSVDENNQVVVQNNGKDKLAQLFLVSIHGDGDKKSGAVVSLKDLPSAVPARWHSLDAAALTKEAQPLDQFQADIAKRMQSALVAAGLYPDEAAAMVNTWKDSWFSEEGDRVLYLLPRVWTDETLPLTLNPAPEKLVRVMVGRAEILPPKVQNGLRDDLTRAANGDAAARASATHELKALGRFAPPALLLVNTDNPATNAVELSYQIMYQNLQAANQSNLQ